MIQPPACPLLPRGVYRAPALSVTGLPVLFAVDYCHRVVDGSRTEVEPGADAVEICHALWRLLDAVDPEHSRRRTVREAAQPPARMAG